MSLRKFTAAIALAAIAAQANASGLIISEIVDATESGGLPKFVELTNTSAAPIDLSGFSLGNANNGAAAIGFDAYDLPAVLLAPGDSYTLSYENGDSPGVGTFFSVYGFDPDNFDQGSFFNGDDVLILYAGSAPAGTDLTGAVDVYGVIGVDGSGEPWEYMDSYAVRDPSITMPNPVFTLSEWIIPGANTLDGAGPAGIAAATSPGTHTFVPEPTAAFLMVAGVAGLGYIRRR